MNWISFFLDTKAIEKKLHEELRRDLADKYDMDDEELDEVMNDPFLLAGLHHLAHGALNVVKHAVNFVGSVLGK